MDIEEKKSIIHRKAKGGRDEFDARVMSPVKALRLALAKVADKMFGLALTVTTVEQVKLPHKNIRAEVGEDGILLLLDGLAGARGAVKVDIQFLTTLIEIQTTGTVRRSPAEPRPVTRTDAAIVQPLLDKVLHHYDKQMSEAYPEHLEQNFRFGDMIEEARLLSLALEAPEYDLYRLTIDLGEGAKTGVLKLFLPHRKTEPADDPKGERKTHGSGNLEKNALEAQVAMDAILTRKRMPLNEVCTFAPGTVIPIDIECLSKAELVANGGQVVAKVRMGQMNGMRAVRFVAAAMAERGDGPERRADELLETSVDHKAAVALALEDDVVEGVINPLGDTPSTEGDADFPIDELASSGDHISKSGDTLSDADKGEKLSAADLMLASNAPQTHNEDA